MTDEAILETFETLLDAEHEALINGDFERISALMQEKQGMVETLKSACDSPEDLRAIKGRLARNHELFDQSLAGLRNVAAHLGLLAQVRKSLHTYNGNGQRETIDIATARRLEKRA